MSTSSTPFISAWLDPSGDSELFSDEQWIKAMLNFESQLALAQAECGVIPYSAAKSIEQACINVTVDIEKMVAKARHTGALGMAVVEPLQNWLRTNAPDGLAWLHWGTTTQDIVDTANAVLTAQALSALQQQLKGLQIALQNMARMHAQTPVLGRSLLQPAQITSFGFKCAQAASALQRSRKQLEAIGYKALCIQLGGAIGNSAVLGINSNKVEKELSRRLGLSMGGESWHTHRDTWLRLGMEVAICGGTLAKIAKDWSLLSQFEVSEIHEGRCGPTSSAMPHKRNSVHCMQAIAQTRPIAQIAATLLSCMEQAHERALGEWQAETVAWVQLWRNIYAAAAALHLASQKMEIDVSRMRANIESLQGVVFSETLVQVLSPLLGKSAAQLTVSQCSERALSTKKKLVDVIFIFLNEEGYKIDEKLNQDIISSSDLNKAVQASATKCIELIEKINSYES